MTGPCRFQFLNVERTLREPAQWTNGEVPKLWLYNLHYFDDLLADGADDRRAWHEALIHRWIAENPAGSGIGWDPYPSSLRITNWIQWVLAGASLSDAALDSLATQARWLARRMEFHLLGNHLLANAKALIFAGTFFTGREARHWLHRGVRVLDEQLTEQILPDGGHVERSPMYHAIVLADVLDLLQLANVFPGVLDTARVHRWRAIAYEMLRWMRIMTHPDGDLAFFNDAVMGIASRYCELQDYASTVVTQLDGVKNEEIRPIEALAHSGYVRLQRGAAVLIADVGDIGPDHQPGHAHADTLSFELSLLGHRVFVNGGVSTYEPGPLRLRQRGTASHNTVVIDGHDSSEVWGSFRVARRARPQNVRWNADEDVLCLHASHDGYERISRGLMHMRHWSLTDTSLRIEDSICGDFNIAQAMLIVHPDVDVVIGRNGAVLRGADYRIQVSTTGAAIESTLGTWHPRFGLALPNRRLEVQSRARRFSTQISWRCAP
ncbi:heparinase II/III family protein [Steroidobacter denitrificans]|nr:alginate lyase family protein [Steroidobacter denitrificans]